MNTKIFYRLFTLLVAFSLSCSFATKLIGEGDDPTNLTAVLTAPDVVLLTWDDVNGAIGYNLEMSIDNGDSFPIISLPPESTSYEDLTAPEKSNLTYHVQVVTESGRAGKSQVSIVTGSREPNPLTVNPEYDEENAIVTTVGVQGGTLSLVDSKKVEYTFNIPEGALSSDTEIRMTAVTAIQGWPLSGDSIGAVRLEPAGLILNDVAILTIGIPVVINPDLSIVGFAFQVDGQEFHLQPSDEENGLTDQLPFGAGHLARPAFQTPVRRIVLPVMELKVTGVGQTDHKSVIAFTKDHAPTDAGAALEQKRAAEAIADDKLAPLDNNIKGVKDPARAEAFEIIKAIYNAENCQDLNRQIVSFQKWRFTQSYQSLSDDQRREYTKQIWDELTDKVKEVLENAATDCEKSSESGSSASADSSCAKALLEKITNPPAGTVSGFNLELKNKIENKLSDSELQDIKDKLEKCEIKAYSISGNIDDARMKGNTCNSSIPFTIDGTLDFEFTPTSPTSGTYTYTGSGDGFEAYGGGPYQIGKGGKMSVSGSGCIKSEMGEFCADYAHEWNATPIDPATCVP